MHTPPDLSIVIPAYQEADFIQPTLRQLANWLNQNAVGTIEVIVATADSPDGTAALARQCADLFTNFRVLDLGPRRGKGYNVAQGMLAARGRYRLFMDADLATPLQYLHDVQRLMAQHADIAVAVRPLHIIHNGRLRRLVSETGNRLVRVLLPLNVPDTQCGFKLFSQAASEKIFRNITIEGWGFDIEALVIARKASYQIDVISTPDWHDPKPQQSGLTGDSLMGVVLQVAYSLLRIKWRLSTHRYDVRRL